eukprot:TRINITY_DN2333_c0_g4_i1.p1 TRINITY_DN2333_c0_g4~~TRINITY_DN2333_c0_g4_i1.p1  ORF type:complete len:340 (+),score=35.83 TRINITY_DN2333_c0_g4_i1:86-1105(+)
MEKYRQFSDGGTGANPFVPPWSNYKASFAMRVAKLFVFLPLAAVRIGVFMLAVLWLLLTQVFCSIIFIGILRRPIEKLLTFIGCAVALLALGVFATGDSLADHRRLKLPPSKKNSGSVFDATRGTIVIANQQGLADVLYLGMKMCPVFVFPASDGSPVQYTLVGALMRTSARRLAAPPAKTAMLKDIAERAKAAWQPVVVFPEGARTNGSCVLAWKPSTFAGVDSFGKSSSTALVSIEYSKSGAYTPHHTVGTSFRHVAWMCMQPFHTLKTVWLPANEVTSAVADKPMTEQTSLLRSLLVRMLPQAVEVDIAAAKHVEFMGFWDASQRRGYTQQTKKTK